MVDLISAGDTAWILGATILVLLMSVPGIAFFYGGLTKKKNVLNSMWRHQSAWTDCCTCKFPHDGNRY